MEKNPYKPGSEKKEEKNHLSDLKKDAGFMSAGLNILVCFLLCGGGGYYIDNCFGTDKWTETGIIFGLAAGFYYFVKFIIDAAKNK